MFLWLVSIIGNVCTTEESFAFACRGCPGEKHPTRLQGWITVLMPVLDYLVLKNIEFFGILIIVYIICRQRLPGVLHIQRPYKHLQLAKSQAVGGRRLPSPLRSEVCIRRCIIIFFFFLSNTLNADYSRFPPTDIRRYTV